MLDSLRARLLLWYTVILAIVIASFAGTVCYLYWRSLVADIDRDLAARAAVLAGALHPVGGGSFDLDRPPEYGAAAGDVQPVDYAVWSAHGELIDRSNADLTVPRPDLPGARTRAGRRELAVLAVRDAVVLVGRDLTETRRAVLSLAGSVAAAGAAALALSLLGGWFLVGRALAPVVLAADTQRRFTADASHELRTPLATLGAEIDWALARERAPEHYRQALETCRRSAARMRRIVEGLLALTRGDAQPALRAVPVRLDAVVADSIELLGPAAQRRQVRVEARLEPSMVSGDRDRLSDLVTNLVSNAIEYNRERGSLAVEVRAASGGVELRVSDTGEGIASDDLPHIFERFYRADPSRARRPGGAGLGLAIVRSIVDAHGGTIACQSTVGQGTEMIVRFPAGAAVA